MMLFFILYLAGLMVMFGGFMNYLIVLLSFEMMFYSCLFFFMFLSVYVLELMSLVVLIVLVVCGSCYGLCLLVMMGRSFGSDMVVF